MIIENDDESAKCTKFALLKFQRYSTSDLDKSMR